MAEPAALLRSPLHDRHVALGAKMADFGGWEMPIEYPGGGVLRSTPPSARRSASSTSATSARASSRGPGAVDVRQRVPDQRPAPDRARAGAVHAVLRRDGGRRRRPHRLPAQRGRGLPHPQRRQHRRGRAALLAAARPTGVEVGRTCTARSRPRRPGPAQRRSCSPRSGCRPRTTTCRFADGRLAGPPVIVCRTGYTGESGYELLPGVGRRAGAVGRAAGGRGAVRRAALRARRARHPAHRDGLPAARPGPLARDHPGAGPGRLGRRLEEGRLLGQDALVAEKAAGPRRVSVGAGRRSDRGIPRAHMPASSLDGVPAGEVTSGDVLADPSQVASRWRCCADRRRGRRGGRRRARARGARRRDEAAVRPGADAHRVTRA